MMQVYLRNFSVIAFLSILFFLHAGCKSSPQLPSDPYAARIVNAAGGAEAISRIRAIRASGTIEAFMRGGAGSYERLWVRDGRLRVDIRYPDFRELRLLDGGHGWRGSSEVDLAVSEGAKLNAMRYQQVMLALPFALMDGTATLVHMGQEPQGDIMLDVLNVQTRDIPEVYVFIDPDGRIVRSKAFFTVGNGIETTLSAAFSDFRLTEGLLLPYLVDNYARGLHIGRTVIERYTINPSVKEVSFSPAR